MSIHLTALNPAQIAAFVEALKQLSPEQIAALNITTGGASGPMPAPQAGQVWPDEVSIKIDWAHEPGTDSEGQQALVPVEVTEENGVIIFPSHPAVINDRTKITFEAGLSYQGRGLHFSEHPHLTGAIEWVAEDESGAVLGTIGGSGSLDDIPRTEKGVGWGGNRYTESGGTLGVANFMPALKGTRGNRVFARVPLAPAKPKSRALVTREIV